MLIKVVPQIKKLIDGTLKVCLKVLIFVMIFSLFY